MTSEFSNLSEQFASRAEKIGLYLQGEMKFISQVQEIDENGEPKVDDHGNPEMDLDKLRDMLKSGDAQVVMVGHFSINDVAFSDRVQHPEKYDVDKRFNAMMPTKQELKIDKLKEKAASGDPLALFEDDEDE